MYEKFISKYNMKYLQPSPGNQLPNEHIWQVAMNTIEERAERVKQASSNRCQLIIVPPPIIEKKIQLKTEMQIILPFQS